VVLGLKTSGDTLKYIEERVVVYKNLKFLRIVVTLG